MLLFFILGAVSLAQSSCPNGGTYQSLFDKCVYLSNDSLAYWDAEGSCQSNGGHLLSITSAFQNSLLSGMLPSSSTDVWIGLFRSYVGSDWKWIDGTPLVYKATFDYNTCQQKNNLYGSISDYIWRCDEYSVKKRYFCELPQTPYVPLTCQNGGNWDDVFQTCLLPGKDALFHDDAAIYCASFGGTLLSIHSAEQNDYLTNYTVTYNVAVNGGIWLGASRAWYGGNWTWDDGTPFAYNRLNGSLFYTDVNYYYANYLMMVIPLGLWDASDSDGVGYGYGFYCSLPKQKYISAPLTSTPATINPICPNGGDYDGIFKGCLFAAAWEKHEFAVVSEWKDGEQVCNSYGGHLVSIHSDEQNERFTLWASMNNLGLGSYLWLGASRSNQLADFTWTDGTPFNYAKVDSSTNDCSVTDYNNDIMGVYIPNGTWSCFSSSDKHDWACLLPSVSAPTITNTPAQRHSTPDPRCLSYGTYDDVFDACIYTSPTKQLYFDAEDDCITKGGHLVSIHSLEQNQRLIDIAMMINFQLGEEAFIGLVRDNSTAPWRWTDGSPVDYTGNVVETACSPGSTQTTLQMTIKGDWSCAHQMFEYYICKIRKT